MWCGKEIRWVYKWRFFSLESEESYLFKNFEDDELVKELKWLVWKWGWSIDEYLEVDEEEEEEEGKLFCKWLYWIEMDEEESCDNVYGDVN